MPGVLQFYLPLTDHHAFSVSIATINNIYPGTKKLSFYGSDLNLNQTWICLDKYMDKQLSLYSNQWLMQTLSYNVSFQGGGGLVLFCLPCWRFFIIFFFYPKYEGRGLGHQVPSLRSATENLHVQYHSKLSYHCLVSLKTCLMRNKTRGGNWLVSGAVVLTHRCVGLPYMFIFDFPYIFYCR